MSQYPVRARQLRFAGSMFQVVTDEVEFPGGQKAARDYLRHIGSVGVVPLWQEGPEPEVVLVSQYRHPVGTRLWELPAGLRDSAGEALEQVAVRELAEEADLVAGRLDLLLDLHLSPGCSDEQIRIFLARALAPARSGHQREFEEASMTVTRLPLAEAVEMIFRGEITNAAAVGGLLATARAVAHNFAPLRRADTPAPG